MKIVSVVGARPQFVKLAPISRACSDLGVEHLVIHTGQHYDANMSQVFFDELAIPAPDVNLGVGSASHGRQTADMLAAVESELLRIEPDWVLAYGDTNSTIATALAAVKIHLPLAHLEAGLRSYNRQMPEEHNRVLTDHAGDVLLCPSEVAVANLGREGLGGRAHFVGDVMVDITMRIKQALTGDELDAWHEDPLEDFVLATIHRAENTDDPERLRHVVRALQGLDCRVVLAAHPRLVARAHDAGLNLEAGSVRLVEPLPYLQMIAAVDRAAAVVTDSGGLQKEAYVLRTPCTTVRTETEWLETLEHGWNHLVPNVEDLATDSVLRDLSAATHGTPYGAGSAAQSVLSVLRGTP